MSDEETLIKIKSIALQLFPGCKVILFGSRARLVHNIDSDYDILVVIDKTLSSEEKMPFRTQIRKTLLSYGILSDILIQSEQEISQKKQLTGHIVKTILQEGVAIWPLKRLNI